MSLLFEGQLARIGWCLRSADTSERGRLARTSRQTRAFHGREPLPRTATVGAKEQSREAVLDQPNGSHRGAFSRQHRMNERNTSETDIEER